MTSLSTSNTWLGDYLSALNDRDAQEQALKPAYDACACIPLANIFHN